jgi:hypothetical protein
MNLFQQPILVRAWKEDSCSRIELPWLLKRLDIEFPARVVALFQPIPQKRGSSSIPSTFSGGGMPHKRFFLSINEKICYYVSKELDPNSSIPTEAHHWTSKSRTWCSCLLCPMAGIALIGASVAASVTREREAEGAPGNFEAYRASSCKLAPFDRSLPFGID